MITLTVNMENLNLWIAGEIRPCPSGSDDGEETPG